MPTKSQHAEKQRRCPNCRETKSFPERNECCSNKCQLEWRAKKQQADVRKQARTDQGLRAILLERLKTGKPLDLDLTVDEVDRAPASVLCALDALRGEGHNIDLAAASRGKVILSGDIRPGSVDPHIVHDVADYKNGHHKFGALGDNHLGSKHERLDVLNAAYDMYEAEGIKVVYNTGNWIEGECRLNYHDIHVFGLDDQIDYWIENYPQRKGIVTYYVAGDDHEGWYQKRERIEVGRYAQLRAERAGRHDLKYLGYVEADVHFKTPLGSSWMKVMHPGGGSAYAISYTEQKIVEAFQGGEKPHILLLGHYHKFSHGYPREVHTVQTGCTVDQSVFMRKQKIQAHVGFCVVRMNQAPEGHINRFQVEFLPFYDRGFYAKRRNFSAEPSVHANPDKG